MSTDHFVTDIDDSPVCVYLVKYGDPRPVEISSSFYGAWLNKPEHVYVHRPYYESVRLVAAEYFGRVVSGKVIRCVQEEWDIVYSGIGLAYRTMVYVDRAVLYQLRGRYSRRIGLLLAWCLTQVSVNDEERISVCRDVAKKFGIQAAKECARFLLWGNRNLRKSVITALGLI